MREARDDEAKAWETQCESAWAYASGTGYTPFAAHILNIKISGTIISGRIGTARAGSPGGGRELTAAA
jgi:hypothetical protein